MRRTASATAASYASGGTAPGANRHARHVALGRGLGELDAARARGSRHRGVVDRRELDARDPGAAVAAAEHDLGHDEHARRQRTRRRTRTRRTRRARCRAGPRGRRRRRRRRARARRAAASSTRSAPHVSMRSASPRPTMPSPRRIQSSGCRGSAAGSSGAGSSTGHGAHDEPRARGRRHPRASTGLRRVAASVSGHRVSLRPGPQPSRTAACSEPTPPGMAATGAQAATTSTPRQNATWSAISAAAAEGVG